MADTSTPGTFIPHDTGTALPARARGSGLNELLLLCGIVLFIASGALAVGVFLYGQYLQGQSASDVAQLQLAENEFEPSLIEQITRLDDRMHAAEALLGAHIAPVAFFQALDQTTLQTVSFQTLDFEAPDPQHITLKMQGVAQSVNSIALQADLFSQSNVISSPIFSNIAREADGVHFDLSAIVNPTALSYDSFIAAAGATTSATPQTQSALPALPQSGDSSSASPFGTSTSASGSASSTTPVSPGQ